MNYKLWKFLFDYGRAGSLQGLFVATDEQVQNVIGQTVYFGEVLGKHSDVYGSIQEKEITLVTDDWSVIEALVQAVGNTTICGYNPLDYFDDEEEDE